MLTPQGLACLQSEKIKAAVLSTIAAFEKQVKGYRPGTEHYEVSVGTYVQGWKKEEIAQIVALLEQDFKDSGWDYIWVSDREREDNPGVIAYRLTPRK